MAEFKVYYQSLPSAPIPPDLTDTVIIQQLGELYQITVAQLLAQTNSQFFIDATTGTITKDINGYTNVTIFKIDSSSNVVNVSDSSGKTIEGLSKYRDGLTIQRESVHLVLNGTDWLKV